MLLMRWRERRCRVAGDATNAAIRYAMPYGAAAAGRGEPAHSHGHRSQLLRLRSVSPRVRRGGNVVTICLTRFRATLIVDYCCPPPC